MSRERQTKKEMFEFSTRNSCMLVAVFCGLLKMEHAWWRDYTTSSVTAVLPPPGQRCGTVCLNSFGNQSSLSDNSNARWKRLCLVIWAAAPCVWTLSQPTRNFLTYLLPWRHVWWPELLMQFDNLITWPSDVAMKSAVKWSVLRCQSVGLATRHLESATKMKVLCLSRTCRDWSTWM